MTSDTQNSDRLTLTVVEAGRKLGLSRMTAYTAAKNGQIPTIRIGRRLLVPKVAFERLLDCGTNDIDVAFLQPKTAA